MIDCVFCKIVAGTLPSNKVHEDALTMAFLDAKPVNIGHALIVPRDHFADFLQTPDEILAGVFAAAKRVAGAAVRVTGAHGFNVSVNNGAAAGQVVFHTHVHVIPRFDADGLKHWSKRQVSAEDMQRTAEAMRKLL